MTAPFRLTAATRAYLEEPNDETRQRFVRATVFPLSLDRPEVNDLAELVKTIIDTDPAGVDIESVLSDVAFLEQNLLPNGALRRGSRASDEPSVLEVDPAMLAAVTEELGATGLQAAQLAEKLAYRFDQERVTRLARRMVHAEESARDADLDSIRLYTGTELLARPRTERRRLLGDLVMVGHNVTITARYKVGKSTVVENLTRSLLTGSHFLGRYETAGPVRVALLNYELDADDMELRVRAMGLDAEALERLLVVNLRGHRFPLMVPAGRDVLVKALSDHGAQVVAVDPFGAAYAAAGGESENDNAEVRRFVTALDEIKRLAECPSLFMPIHTGRAEQVEGDERGRGATVLDDWADVRMILTKDKEGARYPADRGPRLGPPREPPRLRRGIEPSDARHDRPGAQPSQGGRPRASRRCRRTRRRVAGHRQAEPAGRARRAPQGGPRRRHRGRRGVPPRAHPPRPEGRSPALRRAAARGPGLSRRSWFGMTVPTVPDCAPTVPGTVECDCAPCPIGGTLHSCPRSGIQGCPKGGAQSLRGTVASFATATNEPGVLAVPPAIADREES